MNWLGSFLYYLRHSKTTSRYANPAHQSSWLLFIGDSVYFNQFSIFFIPSKGMFVAIFVSKILVFQFWKIEVIWLFSPFFALSNWPIYSKDHSLMYVPSSTEQMQNIFSSFNFSLFARLLVLSSFMFNMFIVQTLNSTKLMCVHYA